MPNNTDLVITISLGERRRAITPSKLAEALHLSAIRPALLRLLFGAEPIPELLSSSKPQGGEGVWGRGGTSQPNERNDNVDKNTFPFVHEESQGASREPDTEALASQLADQLDDPRSIAFYRLVARHVPRRVIEDALVAARDVPRASVRRSRAAIFTSLVKPHLDAARSGTRFH